jgi:hypothetical protein
MEQERGQSGKGTGEKFLQLELKDVRVLYDQATLNCYASIYDYLDAYFDWEQATGQSFTG